MRRLVIFFAVLLFAGNLTAKEAETILKGLSNEWLGPVGEYIAIAGDSAVFFPGNEPLKYIVRVDGDKLTLSGNDGVDYYRFRVEALDSELLELKALDYDAHRFLGTWEPVVFVARQTLAAKPFDFQKVYYSTQGGMAMGAFGALQIEADAKGKVLFSCTRGNSPLIGTYRAALDSLQLQQLVALVKASEIECFGSRQERAIDGGDIWFRFYYNGLQKEVHGQRMPVLSVPLMNFLGSLPVTLKAEKIAETFGLDKLTGR
jgi:hypothetical protein